MKRLVSKVKSILFKTHGETLIEGLASILVFTVLIASIAMMIMVSLRITHNTTITAQDRQEEAIDIISGTGTPEIENIELTIDFGSFVWPKGIDVAIYTSESFVYFEPDD